MPSKQHSDIATLYKLAWEGSEEIMPKLQAFLYSESPSYRITAATLLLLAAPGESIDEVVKLLWDKDSNVRHSVAAALGWHGGQQILLEIETQCMENSKPLDVSTRNMLVNLLTIKEPTRTPPDPVDLWQANRGTGPSVTLIGASGAGKTTAGIELAKALKVPFFDTDQIVNRTHGETIFEIFRLFGEETFREDEKAVLKKLSTYRTGVFSIGAGAINTLSGRQLIQILPNIIHLRITKECQHYRLANHHGHTNGAAQFFLRHGFEEQHADIVYRYRSELYKELAEAEIDTTTLSIKEVTAALLNKVSN